jgi:hypothetical protein
MTMQDLPADSVPYGKSAPNSGAAATQAPQTATPSTFCTGMAGHGIEVDRSPLPNRTPKENPFHSKETMRQESTWGKSDSSTTSSVSIATTLRSTKCRVARPAASPDRQGRPCRAMLIVRVASKYQRKRLGWISRNYNQVDARCSVMTVVRQFADAFGRLHKTVSGRPVAD